MPVNKQIVNAIRKSLSKFDFSKLEEKCTNEAQTRFNLIEPQLEILGYSRIDDMTTEINAGWGKKNDKADIGLIINGKTPEIIIECKKFGKKLTDKEVGQIKRYINVILSTDQFNSSMESWSFYLIGQDYDNIVKTDLQNHETGLLRKSDNHCLYVRRWSDVINEVERRLKYLLDKLKIERSSLITANTPVEVLNKVSNSASNN